VLRLVPKGGGFAAGTSRNNLTEFVSVRLAAEAAETELVGGNAPIGSPPIPPDRGSGLVDDKVQVGGLLQPHRTRFIRPVPERFAPALDAEAKSRDHGVHRCWIPGDGATSFIGATGAPHVGPYQSKLIPGRGRI